MRARTLGLIQTVAAGTLAGALAFAAWRAARAARVPAPAPASAPVAVVPLPAPSLPSPAAPAPTAAPEEPRAACPADMTLVDGDFCPSLPFACARHTKAVGCAEYMRNARCRVETDHRRYCIDRYEWPNRVGENPMVYVDWYEAKSLCASAGKRLCRRSEWILACEGPKRLPFPWGFERQPSPCNIDRPAVDFDVYAMMADATREGELARLWQADRIGAHPGCVSAYGAYDMSGNVDEWTDDEADNPGTPHVSTLNGGYWGPVRDTCRLTTTSHGPTFKFYEVGFRCCGDTQDGVAVPPPRPFVENDPKDFGHTHPANIIRR
jgi:hypothetical protein